MGHGIRLHIDSNGCAVLAMSWRSRAALITQCRDFCNGLCPGVVAQEAWVDTVVVDTGRRVRLRERSRLLLWLSSRQLCRVMFMTLQ